MTENPTPPPESYVYEINRLEGERDSLRRELDDLRAKADKLREALKPFARLSIPDNWPGDCKLRIDSRRDASEYISYHGLPETSLGILPTIAEWREAAEAAGGEDA